MQLDFSIGQLAQLFDVPVPTLRYYDQIGLLTPARVDPASHYRYYGSEQFERLSTIKYFRALGVPLAQIKDFFAARELPKLEAMLSSQQRVVQQRLRTLNAIDQRLQNRLRQVQAAQTAPLGRTLLVNLPPRAMVALQHAYRPQDDIELVIAKLRAQFGLTESIFLGKVALLLSATDLAADQFDRYAGICLLFEPGESRPEQSGQLPAGDYAQLTFRGTHADAAPYYQQLKADCQRQGWRLNGDAVETALIDYGITDDVKQSVTRIQVPIVKHA
ncbi:MerR family transcriptional regulator [Lactiplantibacillus garii]|uniref:MerR family transcriptional regulator n=1 Tax=Lactiplantibacillus garii TaxID=2306423 RepID=A0A3R8J5V0_9LACO|nr:MerR family transcriptional regulator [Lactiplantibacillus garii]RRK09423.1 MerR family transcriptional regulator [Lactiplantibacillus garii]